MSSLASIAETVASRCSTFASSRPISRSPPMCALLARLDVEDGHGGRPAHQVEIESGDELHRKRNHVAGKHRDLVHDYGPRGGGVVVEADHAIGGCSDENTPEEATARL